MATILITRLTLTELQRKVQFLKTALLQTQYALLVRSEERRVGKECER